MLELKDISYTVGEGKQKKRIFDKLSLEVAEGKLVVITGPNGSGKSTLAKMIMGMVTPDSGEILWNRQSLNGVGVTERAKAGIAYSFQTPVKIKGVTARDLIGATGSDAEKYMKTVGLPVEYLDREVDGRLSGGELKRIEIASVLARDVRLAIFDEPEAGIDLWSFDDLVKVFRRMRKERPDGILMIISHQERIIRLADEVIVLDGGKVKRRGKPEVAKECYERV